MLTIIFTFSLFSIAMMIILKLIEERGQKVFFEKSRKRADAAVAKIADNAKKRFSILNKSNIKLLAIFAGSAVKSSALNIKRKTHLKKLKFLDSLRNRGNLKRKGSASFFLKNVSEYKGKYVK